MKFQAHSRCTAALLCGLLGLGALSAGCGDSTTAPQVHVDPTFTSISTNIFAKNCSTSSCHSTLGQRAGLVLEGDAAYASLVGVAPANGIAYDKKFLRVVPGKPDSSFLLIKLTGPGQGEGERMPYENEGLNAQAIDAIRTWIANGAKHD